MQLLSAAWAEAWCEALNASAQFRTAAATFVGEIAFQMDLPPGTSEAGPRTVVVTVERGRCTAARTAGASAALACRYALRASASVWHEVLGAGRDPVQAVLGGQVRLVRGSLLTIAPHLPMARELLLAARRIDSTREAEV